MTAAADRAPLGVLVAVEQLRRALPGGIGTYSRGLLDGLVQCEEEGDDVGVALLASRAPGSHLGRRASGADPLARFGRPLALSRLPGPLLTRAWDHGWVRAPGGYDIVHSVSLAFPPLRPGGRAHSVVTVHDVAWRRQPEGATARGAAWHEAALRRARDSSAALVVTSKLVAADLTRDGVDGDRITVARGGSDHLPPEDPDRTDALLRGLGVEGDFLLTVGTLEPRKNVARLLQAYELARAALPERWPLVIVGPAGWGPRHEQGGDRRGVVFAGAVDDAVLAGIYRRARAFAYVPLTEGYGLPPLESMRAGTPVVVAKEVPSVVELDEPGPPPALVVDPFDVEDIAGGLTAILTDDALRADLVARGEEHARSRTWRETARRHIGLWRSLV
ncbi:MAG: glycosyltransferase family 4 protein [Acidimicrobiales bacterium]